MKIIAMAALLLAASSAVQAQSVLEADAVAYRYDNDKGEIELYYGVLQRALMFKQTGNAWLAHIDAKAEVWENGKVVASQPITKEVKYEVSRATLDSMGANKLLGGAVFTVPYAPDYHVALLWHSQNKDAKAVTDTIDIPVIMPDHDPAKFGLGNLELASSIDKANGVNSPFEKVGNIISPNPSAVFGENYNKLFYYTELYVPKASVDPSQMIEVVSRIVDATGKEILSASQKVGLLGGTIPVMAGLDIDGLAGDTYKLQVQAKQEGSIVAQAEKYFYYVSDIKLEEENVKPSAAALSDDALFALSDLSKLTEQEADDRVTQTLYGGTEADRKTAKSLKSLSEKEKFLFGFWHKKDLATPNAPQLQAYHAFMDRVAQANKQFSYQKTVGWKSARGRVLIVYGPPPMRGVKENLFDPAYKPYITWDYDPDPKLRLTGNPNHPQFVFLDRQGGGNYFLVHSNVAEETSEPDWMSREAYRLSR